RWVDRVAHEIRRSDDPNGRLVHPFTSVPSGSGSEEGFSERIWQFESSCRIGLFRGRRITVRTPAPRGGGPGLCGVPGKLKNDLGSRTTTPDWGPRNCHTGK